MATNSAVDGKISPKTSMKDSRRKKDKASERLVVKRREEDFGPSRKIAGSNGSDSTSITGGTDSQTPPSDEGPSRKSQMIRFSPEVPKDPEPPTATPPRNGVRKPLRSTMDGLSGSIVISNTHEHQINASRPTTIKRQLSDPSLRYRICSEPVP